MSVSNIHLYTSLQGKGRHTQPQMTRRLSSNAGVALLQGVISSFCSWLLIRYQYWLTAVQSPFLNLGDEFQKTCKAVYPEAC